MKRTIIYHIGLALLLLGTGCTRKAVQHSYYLIEAPAVPDSAALDIAPLVAASCEILPVQIHPAFASERIALRVRTHEISYYAYHKWAVNPEDVLIQLLESGLQERRIFSTVTARLSKLLPDYQLQLYVHRLEVLQQGGRLYAHLDLAFSLSDNASRQVVVYHAADKRVALRERDLNLFAGAVSELFHRALTDFSAKSIHYFNNKAAQTPQQP